jgi:glycosyltransferase involved in cell wall biosynthesis
MADYYRRCHATLFTAFNEDQGLTPLEAGTHGKPVVAVNRGGPTEILRHEVSALLAEPEPMAFCTAMESLAGDPALARRLGAGGAERCKLFTWEAFVESIDSYLDTLAVDAAVLPARAAIT